MENLIEAFLLTVIAGLSTVIGAIIVVLKKKNSNDKKFLSISLGFSAGVMIYVSFIEIFVKAQESLVMAVGEQQGKIVTVVAFFTGVLFIAIIDKLIPSESNPHEIKGSHLENRNNENYRLKRMGIFTALAIGIHNFPEGIATFITALKAPEIAIPIVIAIAIHNIPEGIAVAAPIYEATKSKKKAFGYTFLSGLAEPVGAIAGYLILMPIMTDLTFGLIFSGVAGIMVFISLDELLPAAREYGEHHLSIYGLIAGMMMMALSLLVL